jgi:multidrug efflux pump
MKATLDDVVIDNQVGRWLESRRAMLGRKARRHAPRLEELGGFLPIGFAKSSVGEYAGGIFWVVAIALLASWVVAVMFTPYIGVKLLPNFKKLEPGDDPHDIYETQMYRGLRRAIEWCVSRRVTVVLATVGIFVLSIVAFGRVQQQFFPLSERPELFFQLRMPSGTAFGTTLSRDAQSRVARVIT